MRKVLLSLIFLFSVNLLFAISNEIASDTNIYGLENIKDNERIIVGNIVFTGNKITKERIIYREIEFKKGDTLSGLDFKQLITETRENLINTSLFNFVTVYLKLREDSLYQYVDIEFDFIERWYIWPFPILEFADRNFNVWWKTKNFERVNYGFFLVWENFRGRKEKLSTLVRFGYEEKVNFVYEIPYINKKQTLGVGFGVEWSKNHEIAYNTINDTLTYFKTEDYYPLKKFSSWGEAVYRPDIHNSYLLSLKYNHYSIADTVLQLNPNFTNDNQNKLNFMSLYFKYKSDFRDYKTYPLTGYYFDFVVNKYGLGLISSNKIFLFDVQSTFRKYWKLSNRWYFASLLTAQFTSSTDYPYFAQRKMGFGRYFVRGYEYYVIGGQSYGFTRNNLKFAILPTKVYNLGFIPTEKFSKVHFALYLNLFFDFGYVQGDRYDLGNMLPNTNLMGTGLGLDLVTYYDIIFRFEYTINKLKETGFFVHFMAPI